VVLGDVSGDGQLDAVVSNVGPGYGDVSVFKGQGNGSFAAGVKFTVGAQPRECVIAEMTGDALHDVVAVNATSESITVLESAGGGSFVKGPQGGMNTAGGTAGRRPRGLRRPRRVGRRDGPAGHRGGRPQR